MNKFLDVFAIGKRRKQRFITFCCADDVCENQGSQKIVFKYYQFDSDSLNAFITGTGFATAPESRVESQKRIAESLPGPPESPHVQPGVYIGSDPDKPGSYFAKFTLLPGHERQPFLPEKKTTCKKNMHVIHISNSKCFHIGQQMTINIERQLPRDNAIGCVQPCTTHISEDSKLNLGTLLDCDEKLNEDYIALISLHCNRNWKQFGRSLGLDDTFLEEQELRNGSDGAVIVHDLLHKYMNQFPNTSFGFIIYVLSEIHDVELMERLGQMIDYNSIIKNCIA